MLHHAGQPLEQRDAHLTVGVGEELDDSGHDLLLVLVLREHRGDLEQRLERARAPATVLHRIRQRGEDLPLRGGLGQRRHALGQLGEEAVLLDGVLDVESLEEELQRHVPGTARRARARVGGADHGAVGGGHATWPRAVKRESVLLLKDGVAQELGRTQARLRVGGEHAHEVGAQDLRHRPRVLQVAERLDRPAKDLEYRAAEGPPVSRHRDAGEDVVLAAPELGRLVKLGQRLLGGVEVLSVGVVRLHEHLEAAELPVHAAVDEEGRHAHLPVHEVAVDVEEFDGGGERVHAPCDAARRLEKRVDHLVQRLHRLRHQVDRAAALLVELLTAVEALEEIRVLDGAHLLDGVLDLRQLALALLVLELVQED